MMKVAVMLILLSLIALPVLGVSGLPSSETTLSRSPVVASPDTDVPSYFAPDETGERFSATSRQMRVEMEAQGVTLTFAAGDVVTVTFQHSNPAGTLVGRQRVSATANTYHGDVPHRWRESVPLYAQVMYQDIYPGIDLVYFFADGRLKSEFVISPGVTPEAIRVHYSGIEALAIEEGGLHIVVNPDLVLREEIPYAYQETDGRRDTSTVEFDLRGPDTYGFSLQDTRIADARLVIDPVLLYSTYLGGGGTDEARAVATDFAGNTYVTGLTWSFDFPVQNPIQPQLAGNGDKDIFVAKFDVSGQLVYATYFGGSGGDQANAIAADAAGNAYVAGRTVSHDLPVHNAWQAALVGREDVCVLKLDAQGRMAWATYIGGPGFQEANAVAVDSEGRVYVGGEVYGTKYPLLNPWRSATYSEGDENGFISIFDAEGHLIYSTYVSAPQRDQIFAIAVDQHGHVYAAGMTSSPDFPVHNALQPVYGGGWEDCLILKLDPWSNELHFATFLGGLDREACHGIDFDEAGSIYVSGYTSSPDFPIHNAYQPALGGGTDAFVAKLSPSGTELIYATYFGGVTTDRSLGLVSDPLGHVYITGQTNSVDLPTRNALQPTYGGGGDDGFIAIFDPGGDLHYASYWGGSGEDRLYGIALDGNWIVHVAGSGNSQDLSVGNAYQGQNAGASDVLAGRFAFIPTPTPTPTPLPYAGADIGPEGGALWISYPAHLTLVQVPPGALNTTTTIELAYDERPDNQGDLQGIDHFFALSIEAPQSVVDPLQLYLAYQETHGVLVDTLDLYRLDDRTWITGNITVTERGSAYLRALIDQPGLYGILGQTNRLYLPVIVR